MRLESLHTTESRARSWCARVGAKFIRVDRGAVVFEVVGFSRYRYIESDSDDDDDDDDDAPRPRSPHGSAGRTPYRRLRKVNIDGEENVATEVVPVDTPQRNGYTDSLRPSRRGLIAPNDDEDEANLPDYESPTESNALNGDGEPPSEVAPYRAAAEFWASKSPDVNSETMRKTLFSDYSLAQSKRYEDGGSVHADDVMLDVTPARESKRHVRFAAGETTRTGVTSSLKEVADQEMIEAAAKGVLEENGASMPSELVHTSLPFLRMCNSVTAGLEGNFADLCLAFGRSFRLGFADAGRFIKPVFAEISPEHYTKKSFVAEIGTFFSPHSVMPRKFFIGLLRIHLTAWLGGLQVEMETSKNAVKDKHKKIKQPNLEKAFTALTIVDQFLADIIKEITELAHSDQIAKHGVVLFGLLAALYKFGDESSALGDENLMSRLADWALGPAGTICDDPIPSEPSLRQALLLMTIGNIGAAVCAAIEAGHPRLALIIARALESPKDELREDATAQLRAYFNDDEESLVNCGDMNDENESWEKLFGLSLLENCHDSEPVSVDERMILFVLAGNVNPVAQYLKLSWYRLFVMELLHGVGCSELTLPERVCAAVEAIEKSQIGTTAPHKESNDDDAAYHLLKLYANPTASYPVASGVYSSRSIGTFYEPLDGRFPWLFHQILSSVVSCATTPRAPWHLAETLSTQLFASNMPLWAFYVMCTGNPPDALLKQTLIKRWPEMQADYIEYSVGGESTVTMPSDDETMVDREANTATHGSKMEAELFLVSILGVPMEWIHEAKAVVHHYSGNQMEECLEWMATKSDEGINHAHVILAKKLFPEALSLYKTNELIEIRRLLDDMSHHTNITDWSTQGGLVLDYLRYIADIPDIKDADRALLRSMTRRVAVMSEHADKPVLDFAAERIADEIAAALRSGMITAEGNRMTLLENVASELEVLPANAFTKRRIGLELRVDSQSSAAVANRYAAAHPMYSRFLAHLLKD